MHGIYYDKDNLLGLLSREGGGGGGAFLLVTLCAARLLCEDAGEGAKSATVR